MKAIYLIPVGSADEEVMASVEISLGHSFGFEIKRLAPLAEPVFALESQRKQYSSAMILKALQGQFPGDALRLLGITQHDLFIPMLSFVFGQAQLNGMTALISTARLHQPFYGLPENRTLLRGRAVKESIHETGHTFGLTHCADTGCAMSLSNTVWQVDSKREELCKKCSLSLDEILRHLD